MKKNRCGIYLLLLFSVLSPVYTLTQKTHAGVDDFTFQSMSVDYELDKDSEGRSTLKVNENLKPEFPDFNQNRGIIRMIPLYYDNHSLSFKLNSVLRDKIPANIYEESIEDDHKKLIIRDSNDESYLHGLHEYEINYSLRDVTHQPIDTEIDEFYWDINGNQWPQIFNNVSARIKLSDELKESLISDRLACYTGQLGSENHNCEVSYDEENGVIVVATTDQLHPYETLTVAIGFKKDTFRAYQKTDQESLIEKGLMVLGYAGIMMTGIGMNKLRGLKKASKVRKPIVTQFLPPENSEIHQNAALINQATATTVILLDLAVKHKIKIKEEEGLFGSKQFAIEIVSIDKLTKNDKEFLSIYFPNNMANRSTYRIKSTDYLASHRANKYYSSRTKRLIDAGLYVNNKAEKKPANVFLVTGLVVAIIFLLAYAFVETKTRLVATSFYVGVPISIMIASIVGLIIANYPRLSEKGAEIKAHLLGLKDYIRHAEVKRLDFAQSVEGAQRQIEKDLSLDQTIDSKVNSKIILYERLLPYAAMFGLEKSWAKQLEIMYQSDNSYAPTWYASQHGFDALNFSKSINSFSTKISTSSSSSSGSGGGGSAGGGGGGGGGGGC